MFLLYAVFSILAPGVMAYPVGPGPLTVTVYAGTGLILLCVIACFFYAYGIDDRAPARQSDETR